MAERPIFVPALEADGYVKRMDFDIQWAGGFADVQKKKNIRSRGPSPQRLSPPHRARID